jgi:hypothetical protein
MLSSRVEAKMFRIVMIVISTILAMSVACDSFPNTVTVEGYMSEKRHDFKDFNLIWLDGVYNGLEDANIDLQSKGMD